MHGHWTLVDIRIPPNGLARGPGDYSNYKVEATFCEIDWDLHKEDPSRVSFFSGLMEQSKSCSHTMRTFDLHAIVRTLRGYDNGPDATMRSIPPTGVIFHESRCGSTLAANVLAAFAPHKTRVYSEHVVPIAALKGCDDHDCDPGVHMEFIRDVYYVMGRAPIDSDMEYVFYKTNSGGLYIDKFTSAFPDTPWTYIFRDSYEIMQSHWKVPEEDLVDNTNDRNAKKKNKAVAKCSRMYRNPHQPPTTAAVLERVNRSYHELTQTEYCAVHLAGISSAVMQEHERSGKGRFVDYTQMPDVMWETVLPLDFGIQMEPYMIDNMRQFTHVYSKGHQAGRANEKWTADTADKRKRISANVTRAVDTYCPDTYERLDDISQRQRRSSDTWWLPSSTVRAG